MPLRRQPKERILRGACEGRHMPLEEGPVCEETSRVCWIPHHSADCVLSESHFGRLAFSWIGGEEGSCSSALSASPDPPAPCLASTPCQQRSAGAPLDPTRCSRVALASWLAAQRDG